MLYYGVCLLCLVCDVDVCAFCVCVRVCGSGLQVGLMFNGTGCIESMLPGGPAHASRRISKGDRILQVDGKTVVGGSLVAAITGSDIPGSVVTFTLEKSTVGRACVGQLMSSLRARVRA